jgi:hypothetical protein
VPNSVILVYAHLNLLILSRIIAVNSFFSPGAATATPEENIPSRKYSPNRGDDRAVYTRSGARNDLTASTLQIKLPGPLHTGVSANWSVSISTVNWKSERAHTQGSRAHNIPDRSLAPPRMFVATAVESRFAAQTRCESRWEVAAEATVQHLK